MLNLNPKIIETLDKAFNISPNGGGMKDKEAAMQVVGAIQAFFRSPAVEMKAKIQAMKNLKMQAFGTTADMADLMRGMFNVETNTLYYDMFWQEAFKKVPVGANQGFWTIYTVDSGLRFVKVPEGGRIQVDNFSGTQTQVYCEKYGGALGWTWEMINRREVAAMFDKAEDFRDKFYMNQSDNFYALIAAAALLNVTTYQGVAADGQLQRDIKTINQAIYNLSFRLKDKYANAQAAPLVLYANSLDQARIEAAFVATTQILAAAGRSGDTIARQVRRFYTLNQYITSGSPVIMLPGKKCQWGEEMVPTTFTDQVDILTLNMAQSVWSSYGGAIADTDQCETATLG